MISQSTLDFDTRAERMTPPAQAHSETSVAASEAIEPSAGTLRGHVLAFLRRCGNHGATDEEVQDALAMNPSTQRPRRIELIKAGLVYDSTVTRLTKSNRSAVVWRANQAPCRS